jgi:quercetin dioxygenase-like cupin family protein
MSHPHPNGPADLTPVQVGESIENPVTGERGKILELPYRNPEGRATVELTALAGARVVGEHRHPAIRERFTVLEGELTVKREGATSILREGETAVIEPNVWHDWWNASDRDALVHAEITPGERFAHMIETLFGLAPRAHGRQGQAGSAAAGAVRAGVRRRDRVPLATACGAAGDLRRALSDRSLARLSRDLPADLAHGAGASDVGGACGRRAARAVLRCLAFGGSRRCSHARRRSERSVATSTPW